MNLIKDFHKSLFVLCDLFNVPACILTCM